MNENENVKKLMSWNSAMYVERPTGIDYSEVVTEPGQVLSMREIYQRYVAMGVDLTRGELVQDSDDDLDSPVYDPEIEDRLDALQVSASIRSRNGVKAIKRSASKTPEQAKPAESEAPNESTERERSGSDGEK